LPSLQSLIIVITCVDSLFINLWESLEYNGGGKRGDGDVQNGENDMMREEESGG
jgi:hypothetical protein